MRARLRFALVASSSLVLSVAAGLTPRVASACSAPCAASRLLPGPQGSLPASAPGIAIFAYGVGSDAELGFELRDAAGALVAGSLRRDADKQRFFAPSKPLAPGPYTARVATACAGAGIADGFLTSPLTVTDAAPLPTSVGSLAVASASREATRADTSSGSCTEPVDAAVVDLSLTTSPELERYRDAVAWETWVDGRFWWRAEGRLSPTEGQAHGVLRVFAACDGMTPRGRHPGLSEGPHDIALRAHLVGYDEPISPATIRVHVSCGMDNGKVLEPLPPLEPTEPATPPPSEPVGVSASDAGDAASTTATAAPEPATGCSLAPRPSRSMGHDAASLGAALVPLALLALRSRRRSAA